MMTLLTVLNWGRRRIEETMHEIGWKSTSFGSLIQFQCYSVNVFFPKLKKLSRDPI
jgi:hypothetical protein